MESKSTVEIISLKSQWAEKLCQFFSVLEDNKELEFFQPHGITTPEILKIINSTKNDLYYLLVENDQILGYGLMRGWDEGYKVPSLGIALLPIARGKKYSSLLMSFLCGMAACKGATSIRLRVKNDNTTAISLYKKFQFNFEEDSSKPGFLLGIKTLSSN